MEQSSLREIQGERGDGEGTPSGCLSEQQSNSLEEIRQGFIGEKRPGRKNELMWTCLTSSDGLRDQDGVVWDIWVDKERRNNTKGWQVRPWDEDENKNKIKKEFNWVDVDAASWFELLKVPGYSSYEVAQVDLRDGGILNFFSKDGEKMCVRKFGESKNMEEVPPRVNKSKDDKEPSPENDESDNTEEVSPNLEVVLGAKATAAVIRDSQAA